MTNSAAPYRNVNHTTNVSTIVNNVLGDHLYFGVTNRTITQSDGSTAHQEWDNTYGVPTNNILGGDSGSPLFAYDSTTKSWVLAAVVQGGITQVNSTFIDVNSTIPTNGFHTNTYVTVRPEFNQKMIVADDVHIAGGNLAWDSASGYNTSTLGGTAVNLSAAASTYLNEENATGFSTDIASVISKLNNGKTVHIDGESTITLNNNINQGAGALYFHANSTVKAANGQTWLGAGVFVDEGKKVIWQVNNPKYDRLSKVGKGELYVNGTGKNQGSISVGDGVVVLAQQADSNGNKQAFAQAGIVSGRSTVILNDSQQVNPDNIYFGSGGGRLDVNGNDLTFSYIQNNDSGAKIVNNNGTKAANIKVTGRKKDLSEIMVYRDNNSTNAARYILLGNETAEFPTAGQSNLDWQYLSDDPNKIYETAKAFYEDTDSRMTFSGMLGENASDKVNGELNFTFAPNGNKANEFVLMLTGGANLNGTLAVENGTLLLSGVPTPHAMDYPAGREVVFDNDWQNRSFNAKNLNISNSAKLIVNRNVSSITGNINAKDNAQVQLGFKQGDKVCIRSEYNGMTNCAVSNLNASTLNALPITQVKGDVRLNHRATLEFGRSHLTGKINADKGTAINLAENTSRWTLTGSSAVGNLHSVTGSEINLNTHNDLANAAQANTLTVQGNLTGNSTFNYISNMTAQVTDKVVVEGIASGHQTLKVKATGTEPKAERLYVFNLTNAAQTQSDLTVSLKNEKGSDDVDLGAYRYTLRNDRQDNVQNNLNYYLYNAKLENDRLIAEKAAQEAAAKAVAEKAAQEAAAKAAAEKAAQEAAAKVAAEKVAQEAAAKVAAEKAAQEAAAKVAAEKAAQEAAAKAAAEKAVQETAAKAEAEKVAQEIKQKEIISRYSNAALSEISSQVNALVQVGQSIDQRELMEHRQSAYVWADVQYNKTKNDSDNYRQYEQDIFSQQVGTEMPIGEKSSVGTFFTHSNADNDFADNMTGKGKLSLLTLFGKTEFDNGIFVGVDGSVGHANNKIKDGNQQVKFSRNIASVGANVGKKFELDTINIQPSVGVRYHHLSGTDYQLSGANVKVEDANIVAYNAGVKLSKDLNLNGIKIVPSLAAYYVDASNKDLTVKVNNAALNQRFGRYGQYKAGVEVKFNNWGIGTNLGYIKGNEVGTQKVANFELNYSW